jgi:Phage integrase family
VLVEFDRIIAQAGEILKSNPVRTSLSAFEIRRMVDYTYADALSTHETSIYGPPPEEEALYRRMTEEEDGLKNGAPSRNLACPRTNYSSNRMYCRLCLRPQLKLGTPAVHPILGDELRALRRLQREQEPKSRFVFTSERGAPFTRAGFAKTVERVGEAAGLGFKAHAHMLRHACGYKLAATTRGHFRRTWGTRTSSTPCATPNCHPHGLRISGEDRVGSGETRRYRKERGVVS